MQAVGAALFNVRVALADAGWGAEIERIPRPDDPDLLAAVRPVVGPPDPDLAALAAFVTLRDTDRPGFTDAHVPDDVLRRLTEIAELEGVLLIPVVDEAHRLLVARLTQQADVLQSAGSGHPGGAGGRPRTDQADAEQSMVLLATRADDRPAWLCAGEARQHVLLELTRLGWVASPLPPGGRGAPHPYAVASSTDLERPSPDAAADRQHGARSLGPRRCAMELTGPAMGVGATTQRRG